MKDDTGSKSEAIQPLTEQTHNKPVGVAPVDPRLGNITSPPIGSQGFDRAQGNIGFASPPLGLPAHSNRDPRSYIQQTTSLPNKQFGPLPQQFKQSTALSTNISLGSQQSFPVSNNVPSVCPLVPSQTTLNNTLPLCMPLVSQPNSFQSPLLPQPMPQYYDYNHSSTRDPRGAAAGNRVGLMPDKFTNSSVSFFRDNIVSPQYPTDVINSGILQSPRQHFDDHVGPKTDLSMSNYQYPQPLLNNKPCHPTGWSDVSHNAHHYQGSSGYTAPNAYNSNFGHQMGTINNVHPMFQNERHFGQNPYRYVKPGVRPVSHVDNTLLRTLRRESIHSKPYTPCTYSEWKRSKQNADLPDDKRRYPNDRIHTRSPPRSSRSPPRSSRSPPRRPKSPPRRPRSPPKTSTASVKPDSDSKQDGCSSDDLNSPLNSLYGAVIAAKTGRGYGPQKFKIPKRPQEPLPNKQKTQASSDEVPQSNVTDSEDASNKSVTESEVQECIGEKKLLEELVGDDGKMMNSLQEFIFTGLLKNYSKKMLAEKNIEANESTLDKMVKKLLEASDESDVSKHLKKPIKRIIDSDSDDDCGSSAHDTHLSKETKVEELVHSKRYKKRIVENISSDSECSDASSSKVESTKLKSNIIDDFDNLTKSKQTSTCTIDKSESDDENILLTHRLKRQKPGKNDSPTRTLDNRRLSDDFKIQNVNMSCNAETSPINKSAIRITKKKRKIIMSDEESDFSEYNEVSLDKQIEDGEMVSSGKSMIKVKGKKTKLCVGVKDKNSSEFTVFSSPQHIDDLDITLDEETPILKKSRRKEDGLPDTESVMTEIYTGERIQGDESDITRNIKTTKRGRAKKKQIKKLNKGITAVGSELNDEDTLETTSESSDIHPTRKKFKKRNSLELLQEDVKDMFISDDVLTANGYRTCRLSKEILDEMRSEKVSKVEVDEINSFTEKLPQGKVKAKYKSKKVKKIETGDEGNVSSGETDSSCLTSKDFDSSLELGIKVKDKSKKKSVATKANKKTLKEKAKSPRKKKKLSLKNENNIDEANLRAPMVVLRRTDISKCGQEWATKTNMSGRNVARRGRKRGGIHLRGKIIARRPFHKPKSGNQGTTDFFENYAPDTNVAEDTLTEADKFCYFVRPKKWLKPKSLGKSVGDIINKLYQKFGESCPDINSLNALCLELSEKMRTNSIKKTQTFEKIETAIQEDMVVSCKSIESQDHLPIIKGANIVDKVVTDESSNVCSDTGTKKPKQKKTPNRKTSVIKLKKPVGKKRRKHWQQGVIKAPNKLKRKNKLVDDVIKKNKRTAKQKSDDVTCDPPLEHKHFKGENKTRDDLSVEKNDPGKVTTNTKLDENIFSHKTINEASLLEDSHGSDLSKHVTSDGALDDLVTKCTAKSVDSTFKEIEGVNPETIELISDTPQEVDLKTKLANNLFKRTELTSKSSEIKNVTEVDELLKNKTESAHDLVKKANGSNLSKTSDLTSDTLPIVHTTKPTDDLFKETNGSILSNSRDANSMAHNNIDLNPTLTTSESENFDLGTRTQHSVTEATSSEQLSLLKEIPNKLVKKSSNEAFETVFSTSQYNGLSIISESDQPSLPEFAFGQGIKENSNSIISLIEKSVSNWETKSSTIVDQDPLKSSSLSSLETSVSDSFDEHTKSKTRSAQNHKLTKQLINNLNKLGKIKGATFAKKSNKKFISEKSELSGALESVAPMGELNTESSVFTSQKTDEVCSEAEKSNSSAVLLCKDSLNRSGLNSVISWLLEGQEKIHTLEKSTNEDETALFVNIPTVTYNTRHKKIANKSELLEDISETRTMLTRPVLPKPVESLPNTLSTLSHNVFNEEPSLTYELPDSNISLVLNNEVSSKAKKTENRILSLVNSLSYKSPKSQRDIILEGSSKNSATLFHNNIDSVSQLLTGSISKESKVDEFNVGIDDNMCQELNSFQGELSATSMMLDDESSSSCNIQEPTSLFNSFKITESENKIDLSNQRPTKSTKLSKSTKKSSTLFDAKSFPNPNITSICVGPVEARLDGNAVLFCCHVNDCSFSSNDATPYGHHLEHKHKSEKWDGFCSACGKYVTAEKNVVSIINPYRHLLENHLVSRLKREMQNRRTLNFQNAEYGNATAIEKNRNKSSCISDELPENVVNKVESTTLPSNLGENLDDSIPAQNSNKDFTAPLSHPSQNFTVPVTQPSQDITLPLAHPSKNVMVLAAYTSQDVTVLVPHQSPDVAVPVAHTSQEMIAPIAHPIQDISVPLAHSNQVVSDPLTLSSPNEDIDVTHGAPVFRIRVKRLPGDMLSFAKDSLPTPVDINETTNENNDDTDVDVEGLTIDEEAFSPAQVSLVCSDSVFSEQDLQQEPGGAPTFVQKERKNHFGKTLNNTLNRDSSLDLPVISSLVSHENSALNHAATELESELTSPSKEIFDHSYARPTFSLADGEIVAVENTFLLKQSSTTRPSLLKLNPPVGVAAASTSKSACTVNKATLSEKVGGAGNQRRKLQHKSSQAPSYSKSQKMPEVYNIMLEPRKLRHLYKCMGQTCSYTTNVTKNYIAHCKEHEEMRKKPLRKQKGIDWRQCAYCCVNLKTVDELVDHIQSTHGHCLFQCTYCFFRAMSQSYVVLHQNTSHTGEQLAITMCKVVKNISERIDLIKERNEVVLPYICKQGTCNERFYIHKDFYNHLTRQHSQLTMYSCHLCESTSFKPDTLMTHYKLHSYCFYQCMYCVHGGDTKEDMHHHLCNFHPNQPSTVLVRLFQTKDQSSAKNQVEDLITIDLDQEVVFNGMLLMPTPGPIETDEDSEDENDMLNSPTELAHNSGNNPVDGSGFKKQNINKAWKTSSANNKQLKKNTLVIPNNTPEVPFDYKNVDLAEIARTGLTGLDLYLCGNVGCTYAGPSAANLKDHIYICDFARDSRNLVCKHCRRGFKQTHTLVEHVRSHGTKRFGCWMCPYRASTVQNMDRHIKHQHKAKQTECFPLNPLKTDIETALYVVRPKVVWHILFHSCRSFQPSTTRLQSAPLASMSFCAWFIHPVKQPMRTSSFSNSSTTNVSKTSYGPNDVHQLPMNAIFPQPISCAVCQFSTKVRVNLVRHLELHSSSNLSVAAVPSDCPVNPVPCLDKKELMFDKMVNLAASSHLRGEHKSDNTLSQEDEAKIPKYIPEHMRYVCGVTNCKYMACDETMLRYHIRALHCDEMSYKCPHCEEHVLDKTKVAVSIERLSAHLKMHDSHLYICSYCSYYHYFKHVVERHLSEKHPNNPPVVQVIREPQREAHKSL
uniref:C2H2-type domain-containing protein n=1 Tax=Timema poppense TaxID=170557 RepID=A0A7R9CJ53_TIMPO|nr:unnamed protein product [Timema poppensis]